jgi:hypothetical protein
MGKKKESVLWRVKEKTLDWIGLGFFFLTVDCWWADNHRFDDVTVLGAGLEHDLVDVTVESVVGEVGELLDSSKVVVFLVGVGTETGEVVVGIVVRQDTSTAGVEPVAGLLLGVATLETGGDGFGGTFVVRCVGGVWIC